MTSVGQENLSFNSTCPAHYTRHETEIKKEGAGLHRAVQRAKQSAKQSTNRAQTEHKQVRVAKMMGRTSSEDLYAAHI